MNDGTANRGKVSPIGTTPLPGASAAARPRGGGAVPERKTQPRRLVLLSAGEGSEVAGVLTEDTGAEGAGKDVHAELERLAAGHPGVWVAVEWFGPLGWTRFLWCRK